MKSAIILIVLATTLPVYAFADNCGQSERFGSRLVLVGDSERKVRQSAGRPDVERQLETRHGGAAGVRLDYYRRDVTIQVYISAGIVTRICRVTD